MFALRARRGVTAAVAATVVLLVGALLTISSQTASGTYPGGDGKIAFVRSNQIYTINADGTGLKQLTTGAKNYRPKWSPNGQRIAYVHETIDGYKDIWLMSATGGSKTQLTRLGTVTEASWSPDGRFIAFGGTDPTWGTALYKIATTAPTGNPVPLLGYDTNSGCCSDDPSERHVIPVDRFVAWSPDGTRIALLNHADGQFDDAIWMYYPATGENRQLIATGADCCGYNDWSDLTWGPANQFGYADIVQEPEFDITYPSTIRYPGYIGKKGDAAPAPAPANVRLALVNASSGTARIYIQRVNGTSRRLLTTGYQPDWQPKP
jgi:TolB protein